MKNLAHLVVLILLCCSFSQNAYSLDSSETMTEPVNELLEPTLNAQKVFDRLKLAMGLTANDPPFFELVPALENDQFVMAMIDYDQQKITLELTAYELCQQVDSVNGLAFFLGHELAHFQENHEMKNHYVKGFNGDLAAEVSGNLGAPVMQTMQEEVVKFLFKSMTNKAESEADLDGGFIAYLAGYKTFSIGEELLKRSYDIYELDTAGTNYPTLSERIRIVKKTEKELEELIDYFEMANYLIALDRYEQALLYYQKVLARFQSREIYNNIGVLYVHQFLKKVNPGDVKYYFPLELDVQARFKLRDPNPQLHLHLLRQAIENFNQAAIRDSDYPIAHINRGCAHTLLAMFENDSLVIEEQFAIARSAALSAMVLAKKDVTTWLKSEADAHILLGIIEAVQGNEAAAATRFDLALSLDASNKLAEVNKEKLLNQNTRTSSTEQQQANAANALLKEEVIDNRRNLNVVGNGIKSFTIQKDDELHLYLKIKEFKNSKILLNEATTDPNGINKKKVKLTFHLTELDYPKTGKTLQGIKLGDDRKDIVKAYLKAPDREINLGQGAWLIYRNQKIIFQLDAKDKLKRWCVYKL